MTNSFFAGMEDIFEALNIEEHDQRVLREFANTMLPHNVARAVERINEQLWTSYLVWDVFQQTFRLYKLEDYSHG